MKPARIQAKFWKDRPVLVTGATGMIGAWLVKELLAQDARVVALVYDSDPQSELIRSGDINRISVVNGGLEDFQAVERAVNLHEVKTVLHLGAQTIVGTAHRFPLPTFEANIRGTYNLLEVCRLHRSLVEHVVVASSDKAYGASDKLPYTEDLPLKGTHPYEVSKSCADLISQTYFHSYNLPITVARCGNVYGGGDLNWSRIVPGTIRSLLNGESPVIRSDGTFVRDYIYVKDIARAYMILAERTADDGICGEAFNFSTDVPLSVNEIVAEIQALLRSSAKPVIKNAAEGEIIKQTLSSKKAQQVLGWQSEYALSDGLRETIAWYRTYLRSTVEAS